MDNIKRFYANKSPSDDLCREIEGVCFKTDPYSHFHTQSKDHGFCNIPKKFCRFQLHNLHQNVGKSFL